MRIIGIVFLAVGIISLLVNYGIVSPATWAIVWPIALIVAGIVILTKAYHRSGCGCGVCGIGGKKKHVCATGDCKDCGK